MSDSRLILPFMGPFYDRVRPLGEPLFRLAVGAFLMPHGAQKLFGWFGGYGLEATGQYFEQQLGYANGTAVALAAGSVEFFGGLFLALGLLTRISAGAVAVLLAVALTVHLPNGFFWSDGGVEYPLMWLGAVLFFAVKGGGEFSLDRTIGKEF